MSYYPGSQRLPDTPDGRQRWCVRGKEYLEHPFMYETRKRLRENLWRIRDSMSPPEFDDFLAICMIRGFDGWRHKTTPGERYWEWRSSRTSKRLR
jgi:hypothetical protein